MNDTWDFQGELLQREPITDSVSHFVFSVPDDFLFVPGQFITIVFEQEVDGKKKQFRRSYSIASLPQEKGMVASCIKRVKDGPGTDILFEAKVGDKFRILGPLGLFFIEDFDTDMVFISSGTGISPYRSMIPTVLGLGKSYKMWLLAGFRHETDILYGDLWEELAKSYENFTYHPVCSQASEEYSGTKGRVQDLLDNIPTDFSGYYYICGLKEMVTSVREILKKKGVPDSKVVWERYD